MVIIIADCNDILDFINKGDTVVEVGVYEGISSLEFLKKGAFCILIDPWIPHHENPYVDENMYKRVLKRLSEFCGRFTILKMTSVEAIEYIPAVDFVFIDGDHSYEYVKNDMNLYWDKIKEGGIMAGDDYSREGIGKACDEFTKEKQVNLETVGKRPIWMIRK